MLGVGQLGRQALGMDLGLYLLVPFLLKDCLAFGPRAVAPKVSKLEGWR